MYEKLIENLQVSTLLPSQVEYFGYRKHSTENNDCYILYYPSHGGISSYFINTESYGEPIVNPDTDKLCCSEPYYGSMLVNQVIQIHQSVGIILEYLNKTLGMRRVKAVYLVTEEGDDRIIFFKRLIDGISWSYCYVEKQEIIQFEHISPVKDGFPYPDLKPRFIWCTIVQGGPEC